MPWTNASFEKHNRGLSVEQAGSAAKQANAVLKQTGNEGLAIAVANKHVAREKSYGKKVVRHG